MARNGQTTSTLKRATTRSRRANQFAITVPTGAPASSPAVARKAGEFPPPRGVKAAWQEDAFSYSETIEPVGYVAHLTANTIAACDLVLGWIDDDDAIQTGDQIADAEGAPDASQIDVARTALRALKGPIGGIEEIMRRAGLLLTVAGEFYLLGSPVDPDDEAAGVWWEALSPIEITPPRSTGEKAKRNRDGAGHQELDPDKNYLARVHRSDGRYSDRADCALRRCLDTCRELFMLTQMMEAIITTRLPMGLLLMPSSLSHRSPLQRMAHEVGNTEDELVAEEEPEFIDDLVEHLSAPISDLRSAASLVPLVVEGNADDLDSIRIVDLSKDLDSYASALRAEMIRRLAIGLDIPPEVLEGKGGLNHWTGANVDADFLFKHILPTGKLIAAGLTTAYLQPILEAEGDMAPEQSSRWVLVFDPSPIASGADDSEKAMRMWEAGVISDRTLVEKQGWDPDAVMPDEEERARRMVEKLLFTHSPNVRLTDEALELVGIDPKWVEWVGGPQDQAAFASDAEPFGDAPQKPPAKAGDGTGEIPGTTNQNPADTGPGGKVGRPQPAGAAGDDQPDPKGPQQATALLVDRLRIAADHAWLRALEVAGGRLVSASDRHSEVRRAYRARLTAINHKARVCASLSDGDLKALGFTPQRLLEGAWTELDRFTRGQVTRWLEAGGMAPYDAVRAAAVAAEQLVTAVDEWTRTNLHRDVPCDADMLHVPVDLIVACLPAPPARRARRLAAAR